LDEESPGDDGSSIVQRLKYRVEAEFDEPGLIHCETAVVKHGPRAYKTASLMTYGDPETGRVSSRTFRVQTWNAHQYAAGYDFTRAANSWSCSDDETAVIQVFLNNEFAGPGEYLLMRADSGPAALIRQLGDGVLDSVHVQSVVDKISGNPNLAEAIARTKDADAVSAALTRSTQSTGLERLKRVVNNPASLELHIQKVLQEEWWVFGGKYVSAALRRSYTVLDQFDIVLIQADSSLHLIEIKQANIPKLVVKDHNHWIVGDDVHKAVSQAMNYLRSLDEQRAQIMADFDIDCRRASATVVLGHPRFLKTDPSPAQLSEAIRTYNSHLARVEVVTYADLIQTAERFLQLGREQVQEIEDEGGPSFSSPPTDPSEFKNTPTSARYADPWDDDDSAPF
jgi:Shedu protein SduA, C-terminal